MAGRLAIDFGTSNTVVARWDEVRKEGMVLHVPNLSRRIDYNNGNGCETVWVIPSLIHYSRGAQWLGNQVLEKNLYGSTGTFRWMKRYIANRNMARHNVGGKNISYFEAGTDFLSSLLLFVGGGIDPGEEVAFTAPVEAFEHYRDWLYEVAEKRGIRFRLIDEPSAAALGYGVHIQPGDVYMVFDFGGGTLDVSVVLIEESETASTGRGCRVLGKAGADLGGMNIDQWLFQEVLRRNGLGDNADGIVPIDRTLLVECEKAKERLSSHEDAEVTAMNPDTGRVVGARLTRGEFEGILDSWDFLARIDRTVRRALNRARETGYGEEGIKAVLMVGGSSQIPCVQSTMRRIFGKERVMLDRPFDAVGRGAAAFVAGVGLIDHIQHDYAIKHVNPEGKFQYRTIVKQGTHFPTNEPVADFNIVATNEKQGQLGIAIYEVGESVGRHNGPVTEVIFSPSGTVRLLEVSPDEQHRRDYFWMNERDPMFLSANPPAKRGEERFNVSFKIDNNKRLLITARDLKTGKIIKKDYPVIDLT